MNTGVLDRLEKNVQGITHISAMEIREMSIDAYRRRLKKEKNIKLRIVTRFPLIGRGNVMRDRTVSHEDIEASLDNIL